MKKAFNFVFEVLAIENKAQLVWLNISQSYLSSTLCMAQSSTMLFLSEFWTMKG